MVGVASASARSEAEVGLKIEQHETGPDIDQIRSEYVNGSGGS